MPQLSLGSFGLPKPWGNDAGGARCGAPESLWEGQLRRTTLGRTSSGSLIRGPSDLWEHVRTVGGDDTSGRHTERLPIHA